MAAKSILVPPGLNLRYALTESQSAPMLAQNGVPRLVNA
jgi:hypothetical protein